MRVRWIALALGLFALGMVLASVILPVLVRNLPEAQGVAAPVAAPAPEEAPAADAAAPAPEPAEAPAPAASAPAEAGDKFLSPEPAPVVPAPDKGQAALLAEIRALLPQQLDRLTTFADARHDATGFTFVFLFPFLKVEVDPAQLAAILKAKAEKGFCTDPYVQRIFGFGEGVNLVFHSADGYTVYQQVLAAPDCA